ncbi:MAG: hypothetical protein ACRELY_22350 [Polyangiaceae bacterium]
MADTKRILIVLFIPSVERDGTTAVDQDRWVKEALEFFGNFFGGATAFPKARGVWKDDANEGKLIFDEPVVFHCYTTEEKIEAEKNIDALREFCRSMGRATKQGEIGLVIDGEYLAITDY